MQSNDIKVKVIRCDNAAENEKFKEKIIEFGMNVRFELSAQGAPQQNGVVEGAFATLNGRVSAMLNFIYVEGDVLKSLWAECQKTATGLDRILYKRMKQRTRIQKCSGKIQISFCI